ncbi:Manganese-binding lipoprotein MntA [bioreactor metagenome]|uniref:Manganese-binding lipoprotein MntA n=1 Tax=bioreactor metagenome TaxID=1076179 RepID=A0A645A1L7_9ZZZZ
MKKIIRIMTAGLLVCGLALLGGCSTKEAENPSEQPAKLIAAVTIVPEETFVKAVCGELAEVVTLVPPGSNPENYEPTPAQMEKFSKASVYFTVGVPTEEANILPNAGGVKIVSLQDDVAAAYPDRTFEEGERDPHIWLSPKRAKVMVESIEREMCALDAANADSYHANAKAYLAQLDELDQTIKDSLADVTNKKFVVYHPAFGYFADDYGLTMVALEEEGKEATPQHLQDVIDFAKSENIKVIFYQAEIDSSQSAAFAEELGGKTMELSPLAADYIENLKAMAALMAEVMQ